MKIFKMGSLLLTGALFLVVSAASVALVWAAAAQPRITEIQRTADGYMLIGSGFGNDRARVQAFEGNTQVPANSVTYVADGVISVRSQPTGAVQHRVVVAGQSSNVLSFTHVVAAAPRVPRPTITGISPDKGPPSSTVLVTITGSNLRARGANFQFFSPSGMIRIITQSYTDNQIRLLFEIASNAPIGSTSTIWVGPEGSKPEDWPNKTFTVVSPSELAVPSGRINVQLSVVEPDKPKCAGFPVNYTGSIRVGSILLREAPSLRLLAYRELFDGRQPFGDQHFADLAGTVKVENSLSGSRTFDTPGRHMIRVEVYGKTEAGQIIGTTALASNEVAVNVLDCRHQITAFSATPSPIRDGETLQVRVGLRNAASYSIYGGLKEGATSELLYERRLRPSESAGELTDTVPIPFGRLLTVLRPANVLRGIVHLTLYADHLYPGTEPERSPRIQKSWLEVISPPPRNLSISPNTIPAGKSVDVTVTGTNLLGVEAVTTTNSEVSVTDRPGPRSATSLPLTLRAFLSAPAGNHTLTLATSGGTATAQFTIQAAASAALPILGKCDNRGGVFDVPLLGTAARVLAGDAGHIEYNAGTRLRNGWVVDSVDFHVAGAKYPGQLDVQIVPPGPLRAYTLATGDPTTISPPGPPSFNPFSDMVGINWRLDSGIGAYLTRAPTKGSTDTQVTVRWWVNLDGLSGHADCNYSGSVRLIGPAGTQW